MPRLNLTREQFAAFLQDHQQIRQFELLFSAVDELLPDTVRALLIASGNADARAIQALGQIAQTAQDAEATTAVLDAKTTLALGQIAALAQNTAVSGSVSDVKATQALDQIAMLAQDAAVSIASVENKVNQALEMFSYLPTSMRSNQVLTWLSM